MNSAEPATGATDVAARLVAFIGETCLSSDWDGELALDTPLLESGVLDSLSAVKLLDFIRADLGVVMPTEMISAENFQDVRSIAAMIVGLPPDPDAGTAAAGGR